MNILHKFKKCNRFLGVLFFLLGCVLLASCASKNGLGPNASPMDLGHESYSKKKYDDAIIFFQKQLEEDIKTYGPEHSNIAVIQYNIGQSYWMKKDFDKAIEYYGKALENPGLNRPENKPWISMLLNDIAMVWWKKGDIDKSIELLEKAWHVYSDYKSQNLPPGSLSSTKGLTLKTPDSDFIDRARVDVGGPTGGGAGTILRNLGDSWKDKGDVDRAIEYYEKELGHIRSHYPEDHKIVSGTLFRLGLAWHIKKDYKRAIVPLEKSLKIDIKLFGEDSSGVAWKRLNVGAAWHDLGSYDKAIEYFENALKTFLKTDDPNGSGTTWAYQDLGKSWYRKGDYAKAYDYFHKSLTLKRKIPDPHFSEIAADLHYLGKISFFSRDFRRAIQYYEQALEINPEHLKKGNFDSGNNWRYLGQSYEAFKNLDQAIKYFEKSLDYNLRKRGTHHLNTIWDWYYLADAYETLNNYDKALEYFDKIFAEDLKSLDPDHPRISVRFLNKAGLVWGHSGDQDRAIENYEKALNLLNSSEGSREDIPLFRLVIYNNYSLSLIQKREFDRGLEYLEKAREQVSKIPAGSYSKSSEVFYWNARGKALEGKNELDQARKSYQKARQIAEEMESDEMVEDIDNQIMQLNRKFH